MRHSLFACAASRIGTLLRQRHNYSCHRDRVPVHTTNRIHQHLVHPTRDRRSKAFFTILTINILLCVEKPAYYGLSSAGIKECVTFVSGPFSPFYETSADKAQFSLTHQCTSVVSVSFAFIVMASNEVYCFICANPLQENGVIEVKEKGLETFRKSSIKRKDNKDKLLVGLTSIVVHDVCRKRYNNEKLIAASLRRGSDVTTSHSQLRSTLPTFSFRNHCFLCAAEITAEFIAKQKKTRLCDRKIVYSVRKLSMKNSVSKIALRRNDDWGRAIVERLEHVNDLAAADAQYHNSCMKKLYQAPPVGEKSKTSQFANEIDTAMQYIFSYLEQNSEECQFSLNELMTKIEGDYRPHIKTVKTHLLKKYGDDILITVAANKAPVVCLRNAGFKVIDGSLVQPKK